MFRVRRIIFFVQVDLKRVGQIVTTLKFCNKSTTVSFNFKNLASTIMIIENNSPFGLCYLKIGLFFFTNKFGSS